MSRTMKRALWAAPEINGYNTDPDADGSTYLFLPTFKIGDIKKLRQLLPTDYKTGRNWRTRPVAGPSSWSFDLELPWYGLASAHGSGSTPALTDDANAMILRHMMGTKRVTAGAAVTSATAGPPSTLVTGTDVLAAQDIAPLVQTGLPSAIEPRAMWLKARSRSSASNYQVAPPWPATPDNTAILYGSEIFEFTDEGGDTLSFIYQDDDLVWLCTGGRVTASSLIVESTKLVIWKVSIRGNNRTPFDFGDKASLPAVLAEPVASAIVSVSSPVYFDDVEIMTQKIEIDFGINSGEPVEATRGVNGRQDDQLIDAKPTVSINPLGTEDHEALQDNATPGSMHIAIGQGTVSAGVINTTCINFEEMVAEEAQAKDAGGRRRTDLKFMTSDTVYFNGGATDTRVFQVGRA